MRARDERVPISQALSRIEETIPCSHIKRNERRMRRGNGSKRRKTCLMAHTCTNMQAQRSEFTKGERYTCVCVGVSLYAHVIPIEAEQRSHTGAQTQTACKTPTQTR